MTFHQHDVRIPFSKEYLGTFDIVCVRLVHLGLQGKEWDLAAKNLVSLLKLGGYLQWIELDHSNCQLLHKTPGAPATATRKFFRIMSDWFRETSPINGTHVSIFFGENGLEIVAEDVYATDHYKGVQHTPMMAETLKGILTKPSVQNGSMTQEESDDMLKSAAEETKEGDVYQHSQLYTVVGRKPAT